MIKVDFRHIYERTRKALTNPEAEWCVIKEETYSVKEMFQNYLVPLSVIASLVVLIFGFFQHGLYTAISLGVFNLLATTVGTWLSYLVAREYLSGKLYDADKVAADLTVYSAGIFIVFHSLGVAFGNGFFCQLFTLLSFIFIRSLYIEIKQISEPQSGVRTNLLIISSLSIICIPVIINHLLMVIFRISIIHV